MGLGLIKSSYSPSGKKRKTNLWRDGKHWGGVAVNKVLLLTKREGKSRKSLWREGKELGAVWVDKVPQPIKRKDKMKKSVVRRERVGLDVG